MRQQGLLELFTHNAGLSSLEFGYPKKKTGGKLPIRGNNDPRETTARIRGQAQNRAQQMLPLVQCWWLLQFSCATSTANTVMNLAH